MKCSIFTCTCKHEYQDKVYGKSKRVFNRQAQSAKSGNATWKCTVCEATTVTQEENVPKRNVV